MLLLSTFNGLKHAKKKETRFSLFIFHHLGVVLFQDYAKTAQVYINMSADFYIDLVSEVYRL